MNPKIFWLGLLAAFASPSAGAVTQEIRALFTPDSANPHRNEFVNKTPSTGYCEYYPEICRNSNTFSLRLLTKVESIRAMQANADARGSAMFKVPGGWRRLTIMNVETGEAEIVEVRVAGIGSNYVLSDTASNLTGVSDAGEAHNRLWQGAAWVNAAPPCVSTGLGFYGAKSFAFFWKVPDERACTKVASFDIPAMTYGYLDFAYELRTPNPLKMSSGFYTGSLNYRLGPGGDFDFGDVMIPDDPDLTLDFVLEVQHTLKVDIPPGGEKVQLVPAGGWQSWLHAGRKPVRLFRDQTFNISASSRFKMYLICQYSDGRRCYLRNPRWLIDVPLDVRVSLPGGLTDVSGRPVHRQELMTESGAVAFQPGQYVDRKPGTLHFELGPKALETVFLPGIGNHYSGNVTVIWDSEV
ncbi:hypothetical protein [Pseudomonas sp. NFX15]|uniref:hypothetical protein n=1 Tax=Pseudomonas sp. NFX15 TaxID=2816958 RepID=UPI003B8C0D2D